MIQECLAAVDPWGDDRADIRAAWNTVHEMIGFEENETPSEMFETLRGYVTTDDDNELYDEDALAAVKDVPCPT
jgi:hypothetical protein